MQCWNMGALDEMSKIADSGEVETTEHGTDRKSAVGRTNQASPHDDRKLTHS